MTTLYRKWRPQTFAEVRGQERVVRTLQNALSSGRIGHAYLFTGPRGVGKTTTARLLAKALNCLHDEGSGEQPTIGTAILPRPYEPGEPIPPEPDNTCWVCRDITAGASHDIVEIDAASTGRVDDVRDLRDKVASIGMTRYKFYILDEAHQMTKDAFDALLKTLEEPPPRVVFVLATTDAAKLPATVLSRCQRFDFRRISVADIRASLTDICAAEGIESEPAALDVLARAADGSSRDSQSLLDQAIAFCGASVTLAGVRSMLGLASADAIERLATALLAGDARTGLELINQATDAGVDPRGLNRELVEHLRSLLLLKVSADTSGTLDIAPEALPVLREQAAGLAAPVLVRQIKIFCEADYGFRSALQAQLPLELAFLQAIEAATAPSMRPGAAEGRTGGNSEAVGGAGRQSPPAIRPAPTPAAPPQGKPTAANAGQVSSPGLRPAPPAAPVQEKPGAANAGRQILPEQRPAAAESVQEETAAENIRQQSPPGLRSTPAPPVQETAVAQNASRQSLPGQSPPVAPPPPVDMPFVEDRPPVDVPRHAAAETKAEWQGPDAEAGSSSDDEVLQAIIQTWPAVLQAVRVESKNVEALLRSCVATAVDGATVTLACDGEFHTRELQKPENKRLVEAGMSGVAGRPCYVKCVVRGKKPEAAKPLLQGQPEAAKPDDSDPLVRAALRMLNARVLENN